LPQIEERMKNIVVLNGHPDKESFCTALANLYEQGAVEAEAICSRIDLVDLQFDPILRYGYRKRSELEPDLLDACEKIANADHIVIVFPTWWGTLPALLKGFIDRVFLPGFAFQKKENSSMWDKLLKGKSARVIITMDAPCWWDRIVYRRPGYNTIKHSILQYCGIRPVSVSTFAMVGSASGAKRERWKNKVFDLGKKMK